MSDEAKTEKGLRKIIEMRKYKIVETEKEADMLNIIATKKDEDGTERKLLSWLPKKETVGIAIVRDLVKKMQEIGADVALLAAIKKHTPAAKKAIAADPKMELLPTDFPTFNIFEHDLVPLHEILQKEEAEETLRKYGIKPGQLPLIKVTDPACRALGAKPKDIMKITRKSPTAGVAIYYRYVIEAQD